MTSGDLRDPYGKKRRMESIASTVFLITKVETF